MLHRDGRRSRADRDCPRPTLGVEAADAKGHRAAVRPPSFQGSLYTLLPLSILYGVWHIQRGSGGGGGVYCAVAVQ